jgi:hypothetical protein
MSLAQKQCCGSTYRFLFSVQIGVYDAQIGLLDTGTFLANNRVVASPALFASVFAYWSVLQPIAAFPATVPAPNLRIFFADFSSVILAMAAADKWQAADQRQAPTSNHWIFFVDFSSTILEMTAADKRQAVAQHQASTNRLLLQTLEYHFPLFFPLCLSPSNLFPC